ncbi:MAG: BglG family transcription antiterminator [Eubacteriaceae bacterium]|jgi:activator of the mannose operon (transcriptional antiterminator)
MKARMLEIVRFLSKRKTSTYKEIAQELGLKERSVRYDIDCINNELSFNQMDQIEKHSKGVLTIPETLDPGKLSGSDDFVFSPSERNTIIRILILFDPSNLNIRALSDSLQVSRRSVQTDIDKIQNEIKKDGLSLLYEKGFYLEGESLQSYQLRVRALKDYVELFRNRKPADTFEVYLQKLLQQIFSPVNFSDVISWMNRISDNMNWIFSDDSYTWFISNVAVFTWYLVRDMELPQTQWTRNGEIDHSIEEYQAITGLDLTDKERGILSGFSKYTNRYANLDFHLDLLTTEDIAVRLTREMEQTLQINFSEDRILRKGLLNHIGPMMERLKSNLQLTGNLHELLPENYQFVFQTLSEILKNEPMLDLLNDNETEYLAIYFLGSLKRLKHDKTTRALLICGFGYGTSAIVQDTLRNEYQIEISDCIPAYKIANYNKWDTADIVITTAKVELPVNKPCAYVHAVFTPEDHLKLDQLGLMRKNILSDYLAIERRLDYLSPEDRLKTMQIIKEELGYQQVRVPSRINTLSDLLTQTHIQCTDHISSWQDAVRLGTQILESDNLIDESYYQQIMSGILVQGFYSINDGSFALLHAGETSGIHSSCMSLIISRENVVFGDKKVHIIFCLASKDKKEHLPAITRLMRMISITGLIEHLEACSTPEQAYNVILESEKQIDSFYRKKSLPV